MSNGNDLKFEVDVDEITKQFKSKIKLIEQDIKKGVHSLAEMTHSKTAELAKEALGGSPLEDIYLKNLDWKQVDDNMSIVTLQDDALFIEEGRQQHFMDYLLNGKSAKTSKDGKKYAVIPFKHAEVTNERDTTESTFKQSKTAKKLANEIKDALWDKGIDYKAIEYNKDGSPRLGKIHSFSLDGARLKEKHKTAPLQNVTVYQKQMADGTVRKDIMTFRIIHEDHKAEGLWVHPGNKAGKFMDEAVRWAETYWEQEMLPQILSKYQK